jgi:uncharacterized protein (UPF0332 family)
MSEPYETLLYVARLSAAQKRAVFQHDGAFPGSGLTNSLRAAVDEVCVERLILAERFRDAAMALRARADNDEALLRIAVSRAYYSIHHAIRAICLRHNTWDPDGHEASIQALKKLLADNSFRSRSGLAADDEQAVAKARTNRHVADYSPFDEQHFFEKDGREVTERITGNDWEQAADYNIALAKRMLDAAIQVI